MDTPDVTLIVYHETASLVVDPYDVPRVLDHLSEAVAEANEACGFGRVRFVRGANRLEADVACIGLAVECFALTLRSHGLLVEVRPADDVEHDGCPEGARLTPEAWDALPVIVQRDASTGGFMQLRQCLCGSHITLASTRVVRAAGDSGGPR